MSETRITPGQAETKFWRLARRCIDVFFPDRSDDLLTQARELRRKVALWKGQKQEHFYHSEPLHVVYDLSGETQFSDDVWERYLSLREEEYGKSIR